MARWNKWWVVCFIFRYHTTVSRVTSFLFLLGIIQKIVASHSENVMYAQNSSFQIRKVAGKKVQFISTHAKIWINPLQRQYVKRKNVQKAVSTSVYITVAQLSSNVGLILVVFSSMRDTISKIQKRSGKESAKSMKRSQITIPACNYSANYRR